MKPTTQHRSSRFVVATDGRGIVNHAGASGLAQIADVLGFTAALSEATASLRRRRSGHDRGEVLRDLVVSIANGAGSVSDLGALRDQPALFGKVASSPTVLRVVKAIAEHPRGLIMLRQARRVASRNASSHHCCARACSPRITAIHPRQASSSATLGQSLGHPQPLTLQPVGPLVLAGELREAAQPLRRVQLSPAVAHLGMARVPEVRERSETRSHKRRMSSRS